MRYLTRLLILVAVLWLLVTPVLAQGSLIFDDETGSLNRGEIERAAQPLINRGAQVAVYMTQSGDEADFRQRLEQDGLVRSDGLARVNMVAIYVGLDSRYSGILFGENWNEALATNENYDFIRTTELNPALASGNFTEGYVNALRAIDGAIANPPQPGGGTNINFSFIPIVIGVFVLIGLFVGWGVFSQRRAAAKALNDARERAAAGRQAAGGVIADLGRQLKTAQEKAAFDRVSYTPADVAALAHDQNEITQRFAQAQNQFDDVAEKLEQNHAPTIEQYDQATQGYAQVQQAVEGLQNRLNQVSTKRRELDDLARQAPGAIDNAKKNLSSVADQLAVVQSDIPDTNAVLAPVQSEIAAAEQALANHDARQAIALAQAAVQSAQALAATLDRFGSIREGIVGGRNDAETLAAEGYRMEASETALDGAQQALAETAHVLQTTGVAAADQPLIAARQLLDEALANGRGLKELQAENMRRLAEIEALGQEVAQAIVVGHQTFDMVDEFAESTWSDIRGNGSEAESSADRAHEHWQNAQQNNTMDAQEFHAAKEDLDAAAAALAYARSLIDAITLRLKDLETARDTARAELAAAAEDIQRGWEFVRANDPDVGKQPENELSQAEQLLAAAQAEIQKEKPDWLELVRQAQAANNLADQALAGALSEVEAMEKLRTRAAHAQQTAAAEVQKIVAFAGVHGDDIQGANQQKINAIQRRVQQAYALMQQVEQTEEGERSATLQQAYEQYTQLQSHAAQVYADVYKDFQRLEELRANVNRELSSARNAVVSAEATLNEYRSVMPANSAPEKAIKSARRRFDQIRLPIAGEQNLQAALNQARDIAKDAREAEEEIRRTYKLRRDGDRAGDLLTGMVIGSLLDSATHDRKGGWGGSGSWSSGSGGSGGSGGGGWGSLGGGGGSWGGGGGGGGSFGGGGGGGGW